MLDTSLDPTVALPRAPKPLAAYLAAFAAGAVAAGCGGGGTTDPPPAEPSLAVAEMVLVDGAGTMIYSHRDHWHGFPLVPVNGRQELTQYFVARSGAEEDHDPPPRADWFTLADHPSVSLSAVVTDTTIGRWTGDKVRGAIEGRRTGASVISYVVRRGATTLKEIPPLNFVVR